MSSRLPYFYLNGYVTLHNKQLLYLFVTKRCNLFGIQMIHCCRHSVYKSTKCLISHQISIPESILQFQFNKNEIFWQFLILVFENSSTINLLWITFTDKIFCFSASSHNYQSTCYCIVCWLCQIISLVFQVATWIRRQL